MVWGSQPLNNQACPKTVKDFYGAGYEKIHITSVDIPPQRMMKLDPAQIRSMADSIREIGLIVPVGLYRVPRERGSTRYVVVYGAKRVAAMQLLYEESISESDGPGDNPDSYQYSTIHALVYSHKLDEDHAQELEIRENLDRFELTEEQKQGQTALLLALIRKRQKETKSKGKSKTKGDQVAQTAQSAQVRNLGSDFLNSENGKDAQNGSIGPGRGRPPGRVTVKEAAQILGISNNAVANRIKSLNKALGLELDPEKATSEELQDAGRRMMEIKPVKPEQKKEVKMAKAPRLNVNLGGDPDRVADSIRRCLHKYLEGDVIKHIVQVLYDEEIGL